MPNIRARTSILELSGDFFRIACTVLYLIVHCLGHVVVGVIGVVPGKDDDFAGTISQQLQIRGRTGN